MAKYIDAEKLKAHIQYLIKKDNYELFDVPELLSFIDSLQKEQPIKINTLTWKDINDLERIINNVHYEFRNGISEKSFGEEVLERFREERDEQEQPEVDLRNEINRFLSNATMMDKGEWKGKYPISEMGFGVVARHFFNLGLNARKK